jgi:MFS family permease
LDSGQRSPSAELLDDLVERAGCGWYQVLALLPLMGIFIAEGAELLVTSCVAAGLQQEWGLTAAQKGGLSSLAFLGLAVGTLVSGLVADSLGRRIALLASYAGMAVLGAASAKAVGFTSMAACRLLNGAACGVGLPASFVLLSELFPKRHRSTSFAVFGAAKGLGEIYVCCAMLHWMPDLRHGDWRSVTLVSALPAAVFLLGSLLFLRESVHWLSVQGRMVEVRTELLEMARLNGRQSEMESLESAGAGGSRAFDGTESMSTNRWRWEYLKDAPTSKSGKRERDFGTPLRSLATNPHILYKMLCACSFAPRATFFRSA